jgi:hypothetical protein
MATVSRAPTSDYDVIGTWTGSAGTRYTVIDDYPDSGGTDELTVGTIAGYLVCGFSSPSIPTGSTINSVTIDYYDYKNGAGVAALAAALSVGGTIYNATYHDPANATRTSRSDVFTTNPATSSAWTVNDVNGTGANPLQAFGVRSNDANPTVTISSIQLTVDYTAPTGQNKSNTFMSFPF